MEPGPDQTKLIVFLSGVGTFWLIEGLWSHRPWATSRPKRLLLHSAIAVINTVIVRLTVATPLALLADHVHTSGWGLAPWLGLDGVVEIAASFVVLDMLDYWWHRANHQIPFLWRFHQAHHVDTHMDVTTALRFHPGELVLSGFVKAGWIVLWGPSIWGFAVFEIGVSLAAQYHHSNIDFSDRIEDAVRTFNVTPRMHASHHSARSGTLQRNFSTIFSVWDRLFGTYTPPTPEHLQELGLPYGRDRYQNLTYHYLLPFKKRGEN